MDYSHNDGELARQPIGYWGRAASDAVVAYIREGLATHDLTQPQWWILNQLAESPHGRELPELARFLGGYLDMGDPAVEEAAGGLVHRGLVTADDRDRLHITPEGEALKATATKTQTARRDVIHDGVTDEEYVRTLKVLQRMIHNVDGTAWHH
ncbi:MarR family winged helix-turn-helix transcriptional regulator [Streptomyces uncialis]|uniref:MarR family winged helix-turn-helix transcriptional regulator n=1 Tax=Streptomyces uncialis TaxID=1048205 RepID=UPI00381F78D1